MRRRGCDRGATARHGSGLATPAEPLYRCLVPPRRASALLASLALLSGAAPARAGACDVLGFGPAGVAEVGARAARADDGTATFYNPGGLALGHGIRLEVTPTYGASALTSRGQTLSLSDPFGASLAFDATVPFTCPLHDRIRIGFGGYLPPLMPRGEARYLLDFPMDAGTALLCLAYQHTERELLHLVEAFQQAKQIEQEEIEKNPASTASLQLLLVGPPCDKEVSTRIIKLAAHQPALHLHLSMPDYNTLSLYLASVDALALPHFAVETAGLLESALLALSYGRVAVVPNLPRFRGMLPPRASIYYDPTSRESLTQALLEARRRDYRLTTRDKEALEAKSGWEQYAVRLVKVYREVLERPS